MVQGNSGASPMSTGNCPSPHADDILIAAKGYGWPAVTVGPFHIDASEESWRDTVEAMTAAERLEFWHRWGDSSRRDRRADHSENPQQSRSTRADFGDDSPDARPLAQSPPVPATFSQMHITCNALRHLRRIGVSLPQSLQIEFRRANWPATDGGRGLAQHLPGTGHYRVLLHAGLHGRELVCILAHEVQHIVDMRSGRYSSLSHETAERRANDFGLQFAESFARHYLFLIG
jgi:hypothetical protein